MSFSTILSAAIEGLNVEMIHVEADVSNGLPVFHMVGYLSSEVKEAGGRVRTAIRHSGYGFPPKRTVINLSPATMTVTLKRMERAGLIEREMDGRDQRILRVHLSEEGKRMCEMGERQVGRVAAELLDGFSAEERAQFEEYMRRVAQNMERALREEEAAREAGG